MPVTTSADAVVVSVPLSSPLLAQPTNRTPVPNNATATRLTFPMRQDLECDKEDSTSLSVDAATDRPQSANSDVLGGVTPSTFPVTGNIHGDKGCA